MTDHNRLARLATSLMLTAMTSGISYREGTAIFKVVAEIMARIDRFPDEPGEDVAKFMRMRIEQELGASSENLT